MRRSPTTAAGLDGLVDAARALGHHSRVRILAMLHDGPLCVCQITAVLGLSGSTVSAHLSDLRRAGLAAEQKRGKWVHYRLSDDPARRRVVREVLRLVRDDPTLGEDARVIAALRGIPVAELCRAGRDLSAVGVKPFDAKAVRTRKRRRRIDREA